MSLLQFGDGPFGPAPPFPGAVLDFVNDLNDRITKANALAKQWSVANVVVDSAGNLSYPSDFAYDMWLSFVIRWNDFYQHEQSFINRIATTADELNNWESEWEGWQPYLKKVGYTDVAPFAQSNSDISTVKIVAIAAIALAAAYGLSRLPSFGKSDIRVRTVRG